ncbi:SDR family oxidoreductase [Sphingosinicella sp. BN140058]|uniref:SDR family oxidoreductase n=1 Tax=Sphingosinicella sp. BN140058 TaxID=1892855 RepID=UPI0010104220|nr:SDR family oxidoreductase [Sphingosinicella sp. BN140058]QAY76666.1 SDR family oxidoreductase [Sphingosinicella sp. BN140058]
MTQDERTAPPLQLWGGVECTIVRLGDEYRDQTVETGHFDRPEDIERIADLGVTTVRYPILWEAIAPESLDRCDWRWTDERLEMLRARNIDVIGGLTHHGSGPRYTELLDPAFPEKLAAFAAKAAERYPWIEQWTPVNEPLTTARFSALYGHWYPHTHDHDAFLRALVNECKGTAAAMRAIRAAIPHARLVQTEDLGKCYSTEKLAYQAAFENERRWLSLDLQCGMVDAGHPMRSHLLKAGVTEAEIDAFASLDAKPDIIGINHYLTSERFLDDRIELYPGHEVGGNGRDRYVDAEAVRVQQLDGDTGIVARLREAWERYRLPMAITEVHHGCFRDEQLRWFVEVWNGAKQLQSEGVDLRAVTLWSMFGNVDWRFLLAQRRGFYDPGVFDARTGTPRPTIVAEAARAIGHGRDFDHPVLDSPGWWRRPPRLYPWSGCCDPMDWGGRKLLITGATGTLGNAFARSCEHRALSFCLTDRAALDITDERSIAAALAHHKPWAVINTAGFVRVADAEREQDACVAANTDGAEKLARACAAAGIPYVTFSSDLVFDGQTDRPYVESDAPKPACVYGLSKAAAEARVLAAMPDALIVRTSAFFGPWDRYNFAWHALRALSNGEAFRACERTQVSPTYVPDLCHAVLDLLIDGASGIWHVANEGQVSWYEFARRVADRAGLDTGLVVPLQADVEPGLNVLASERGGTLRALDEAIDDYVRAVANHPDLARPALPPEMLIQIEPDDELVAIDLAAE